MLSKVVMYDDGILKRASSDRTVLFSTPVSVLYVCVSPQIRSKDPNRNCRAHPS